MKTMSLINLLIIHKKYIEQVTVRPFEKKIKTQLNISNLNNK